MRFFTLCLVLLAALVWSQEEDIAEEHIAKVILHKFSDTNPVAEGRDFVISYELVNVGNAAASSIEIGDRYDTNSFEVIGNVDAEGIVSMQFEELAPGARASFNVTVRPKLFGIYESTRARIKYVAGVPIEGVESDARFGYSTSLGRTRIISAEEAARDQAYFVKQWLLFAAIVAVPTVGPLFLMKKARR